VGQQGFMVPGASNQIMNFKKSLCFTVIYFLGVKNFELVECRKLISYLKYSLFNPWTLPPVVAAPFTHLNLKPTYTTPYKCGSNKVK